MKTNFTWVVENFSSLSDLVIYSPGFGFASDVQTQFRLELYPRGSKGFWEKCHALIFLWPTKYEHEQLNVRYHLSLLNVKSEKCNTQVGCARFKNIDVTGLLTPYRAKMEVGWQYNISLSYLANQATELLPGDKLTIYCEVDVIDEKRQAIESICSKHNNLLTNYRSLLDNGTLSDVTLVAGTTELRVHKAILAAQSPVFCAMFCHDTKEQAESKVVVTDVPRDVLEKVVEYIYTGEVLGLEQLAAELLEAADKYQVDSLKSICEEYLIDSINTESVSSLLLLADRHSAAKLKCNCVDYLTSNASQVIATNEWESVSGNLQLVNELFQHLTIKFDQIKGK